MKLYLKIICIIIVVIFLTNCSSQSKNLSSSVITMTSTPNKTIEITLSPSPSDSPSPTLTPTPTPKKTVLKVVKTTVPTQNVASGKKIAYITIDDGPSASITPLMLGVLKKHGVKATFFVLHHTGVDDMYKRIINEGHSIGNHTYSHNFSELYTPDATYFKEDVKKLHDYLKNNYNYTPKVFRFPGGSGGRSSTILDPRMSYIQTLGYKSYNWTLSIADTDPNLTIAKYGSEENIIQRLTDNVVEKTAGRSSIIMLMHDCDGKVYTPKALDRIITGLKDQGYSFGKL